MLFSMRRLIIAIDGPAGAGKSTVAQRVAQELGYLNIESGAMYRALALKALEAGAAMDEEDALGPLAEQSRIELAPAPGGNRVLLDGTDVTLRIRESSVTEAASRVSAHPRVRAWMVDRQREMGQDGGVVMEGRDIGTQVFPYAEVKIFLEASPEVRAERRIRQEGGDCSNGTAVAAVAEEIRRRDERDRTRAASPLVPAPDAVVIDSSTLGFEQVVARILGLARSREMEFPTAQT
jgi:cytidylate kinase